MNGPSAVFPLSHLSKLNFQNHSFFFSLVVIPVAGFCSWVSALTSYIPACLSNLGASGFLHDPTSLKDLIRVVDFPACSAFFFLWGWSDDFQDPYMVHWTSQQSVRDVLSCQKELRVPLLCIFPLCSFSPDYLVAQGPLPRKRNGFSTSKAFRVKPLKNRNSLCWSFA